MNRTSLAVLILTASTISIFAQQPQVSNTQFHSEPAGSGLSATVDRFRQSNEPIWIGYSVPALPGTHHSSCGSWKNSSTTDDGCCGEYQLEGSENNIGTGPKQPSSNSEVNILLRAEHGAVQKIRAVMAGCKLNAGGVAFDWITGVTGEESVAFLGATAEGLPESGNKHLLDETLVALSMHATPKATEELAKLASPPHSLALREKAAFWLGAQRGPEGLQVLKQLVKSGPDSAFREKLAFDIYINSDPAAIDELIKMANADPDAQVRGQAIFWLAQKAGQKATTTLQNAVDNDPDLAVKKKAVFGLSQMPKDQGIPQLIHVADTNSNPTIRKEAIFWLGQTKDPRALRYIEQVLQR